MIQEIYLIDNQNQLEKTLRNMFKDNKEYSITKVTTEGLEIALKNIPSLIIVNEDSVNNEAVDICKKIKEDEDNVITPIIVITSQKDHDSKLKMLQLGVSHYIRVPVDEDYLYCTINNILNLLYANRKVSPLTGLPGNVQIRAEMKKRLLTKEEFAMMYFDLDNFKAYNDVYGFMQGDEIIKFTAKVIQKNVHTADYEDSFVGHIGGDDFIAIISDKDCEKVCQDIVTDFDNNVKKFFTDEDAKKGYLEVVNRKGIIEQFPLTAISIGVVEVKRGKFKNVLEIGEAGASVKHLAKTIPGSTYVIDRRKHV